MTSPGTINRRNFIRTSAATLGAGGAAATGLTTMFAAPERVYAHGRGTLRVGLVGCGGRGSGAANNAVTGSEGIELVAMGDLMPDRLSTARERLSEALGAGYAVDDDHAFSGFDAYRYVIDSDIDLVILATPPFFRPEHLAYAIERGRHVFMEKPIAVDPIGVRSVIASSELAARKNLAIVSGTQRRHDPRYIETIGRIRDGAIGDVIAGQVYWNQGGLWNYERVPGMSDMEWQIRNWLYFTWLSGDHIVEQHIHNLDVANWVMGGPPVRANGVGGRQMRVDPSYGHIFDHFCVELEYANGARVTSMCRQQDGTARYVGERFAGTLGASSPSDRRPWIEGRNAWRWPAPPEGEEGDVFSPYVQEHTDLVASIRNGAPLNEGRRVAESTLTAILAREAAYTGSDITWDEILASDLDLTPGPMTFGPVPMPPVAQPGVTQLSRPPFGHMHEQPASG